MCAKATRIAAADAGDDRSTEVVCAVETNVRDTGNQGHGFPANCEAVRGESRTGQAGGISAGKARGVCARQARGVSGEARGIDEAVARLDGSERAAEIDEGNRPDDEVDTEEPGGRSARRVARSLRG
jgi:hypothetical protein